MTVNENVETFGGLRVVTVRTDEEFPATDGAVAWRYCAADYHDDTMNAEESLTSWLARMPSPETVTALVVGLWPEPYDNAAPLATLTAAAARLPALTHLFVGEMTYEENEMSWITQGNYDDLLTAWAGRLVELRVRGAGGLTFAPFTSASLRTLAFETGGLPVEVVRGIAGSTLPALEDLELWLGTDEYTGSTKAADLAPLLASPAASGLTRLGLKNSEDPLGDLQALVASPVLPGLSSLDLSLGVLGGECLPLLTSGSFAHLRRLDLTHHYLDESQVAELVAALPGVEVVAEDPQTRDAPHRTDVGPYAGRWVSVSE